MRRYIPQDDLDDARDAVAAGRPLADVAGRLGVSVDELAQLLRVPRIRPIPEDPEICLFSPERMQAVL